MAAVLGRAELEQIYRDESANRDAQRRMEKAYLTDAYNLPEDQVVALEQVHGATYREIDRRELGQNRNHIFFAQGDALLTADASVLLCIRTADCLPVFLDLRASDVDDGAPLIGLIHAGWRGLAAGVVGATVNRAIEIMSRRSNRLELVFAFGPCIEADRYEVGGEVIEHFEDYVPANRPGHFFLDLQAAALRQLQAAVQHPHVSIETRRITTLEAGTLNGNDRYYSHRAGDTGRNLNIMMIESTASRGRS